MSSLETGSVTRPLIASADPGHDTSHTGFAGLVVGAIGVVYGDVGTSPLYTLREVFHGPHAIAATRLNILSILSMVFWSLLIVISIKYVMFIMRADNRGEGGTMALVALALRKSLGHIWLQRFIVVAGIFGTALFFGDGMITPAISVLSAVEGLGVAAPGLNRYVIPITIAILLILFLVQRHGTARVGALFGPIMCVWFVVLAGMGMASIVRKPEVLSAFNPYYAFRFVADHGFGAILAFGAVVLAITGAEALYADMGHFGRKPIQTAWIYFVMPALMINYLGQGALIMMEPESVKNPFYHLAPEWALMPLVLLATAATVIASQAVISGCFSISRQVIQLGYAPRLEIRHTSEREIGQIYVPLINWILLVAVVALVLGFRSSSNIAAAYGIAVTGSMLIDTLLVSVVALLVWRWRWPQLAIVLVVFLVIDLAYFSANAMKIPQGAWFPLVLASFIFLIMYTWKRGRELLAARLKENAIELKPFLEALMTNPPVRVPGTAVFMTSNPNGVPHALLHNLNHNKVLHERVVLTTVKVEDIPHVPVERRISIKELTKEFFCLSIRYGFKDDLDVPVALELAGNRGLVFDMMQTSFFLGRDTLIPSLHAGMPLWMERLYVMLFRNETSATAFFNIPTNRVVELGTQIEI